MANNFGIQEREDDMLICADDWMFGSRCIARRPKLVSNDDWRPVAERIVRLLQADHEASRVALTPGGQAALRHGEPDAAVTLAPGSAGGWRRETIIAELRRRASEGELVVYETADDAGLEIDEYADLIMSFALSSAPSPGGQTDGE